MVQSVAQPASGRATAAHLDRLYPLPRWLTSSEDLPRHLHRDLPAIPTPLLVRERWRVNARLKATDPRDNARDWLEERLVALEEELASRRATRHARPQLGAGVA